MSTWTRRKESYTGKTLVWPDLVPYDAGSEEFKDVDEEDCVRGKDLMKT